LDTPSYLCLSGGMDKGYEKLRQVSIVVLRLELEH